MSIFNKTILVASMTILAPMMTYASHTVVNCGSPGFWDASVADTPTEEYIFLALKNDSTAMVKRWGEALTQLGDVKAPPGLSLRNLDISGLRNGDRFEGSQIQMTLVQEFTRPRQPKNRRFFRVEFSTASFQNIAQECVFGLK